MIVTDLDNTLLRRDKTISNYTKSIFSRCADAGIKIVFATARPVRAVTKWLNLDIRNDACICHNGAVIYIGGELFLETGIEHDSVCRFLDGAKQFDKMKIAAEINDTLYANFDASTIWPGVEYTMTDFDDLPMAPADKLIFVTTNENEIKKIERLCADNLYWEISENEVLMIMNINARKINAVKKIAAHYGFSPAETVAFGDDYNDVEMLRECGAGVAVNNAIDAAKAAADFVCGDCDDDGVSKWLEKHIL